MRFRGHRTRVIKMQNRRHFGKLNSGRGEKYSERDAGNGRGETVGANETKDHVLQRLKNDVAERCARFFRMFTFA